VDFERACIVLGVEKDTPVDDVEKRYWARARILTPDVASDDALRTEAAQAFEELNAAWAIYKQHGVPALSAQDVRNVRFTVVGPGEGLDMGDVDGKLAFCESVLEHFEEGGAYLPMALDVTLGDGSRFKGNRRRDGYAKGEVKAFLSEVEKAIDQWQEVAEVSDAPLHSMNGGSPAGAGKWGIKEYVAALAGLVLILFLAGLVKWENGSVALTDRSERFIESWADDWAALGPSDPIPEGWGKVVGTGYSYGIPDHWYYAEPEDKYQVTDKRTADSTASNKETNEDSSAIFTVLTTKPIGFDDFDAEDYAKALRWTGTIRWSVSENKELHGKSAIFFKGHIENSGVTVMTWQVVVPEEGNIIDMKYQEGSDMKNTLQKILSTWTWDE
jgi:DivIVA domain-containing protein